MAKVAYDLLGSQALAITAVSPSPVPEVINPPVNEDKIEPIAPPVLSPSPLPTVENSN